MNEALPFPAESPTVHARTEDPDTSHAAARTARYADRWLVLSAYALQPWGMTDHAAYRLAGLNPEGSRQRCSDLRRLGHIADTGRTAPSPSGRAARVSAITTEGRAALRAHMAGLR